MQSLNAMARIDPQQLLKALSPLLGQNGGIKGASEASRISSLMKDATKIVAKCVYINILRTTISQDALEKFIQMDGWDTLNNWLQDCKDTDNKPLLTELLKVYEILPVSIDILKQNNAAKTIKQFSKSGDEKIKILAAKIVDCWMKKIRGKSNSENDEKNKKKKEKHHKDKKDKKEKSHHHHHHHHHDDKEVSSRVKDESVESSEPSNSIVHNDKTVDNVKSEKDTDKEDLTKKRPKTVKTYSVKFRATGLEDQTIVPVKKKNQEVTKLLPPKRVIPESKNDDLPEKKPRLSLSMLTTLSTSSSTVTTPTISPPEIHGRIKLIPPKRPPAHEIQDSSGFMDSLTRTSSTYGQIKRKKKNSSVMPGKGGQPTSPTSPTTAIAQKLPSVPSFYKDTLDTSEEAEKGKRSPSPTEKMETGEDGETIKSEDKEENQDVEMKDKTEEEDTNAEPEEDNSETASTTSEPKGLLTTGSTRRKKAKKKVTWVDDAYIRQMFYFELDETERENVNKPKDFNQMKKQEMIMDRRAMESAKRLINDNMVEAMQWRRPVLVEGSVNMTEMGANSTERDVQKLREQKVLQAFICKDMLPDGPSEPDLETIEPSQPKIIPLEDESSSGEEYTYTYDDLYKKTSQPPEPVYPEPMYTDAGYTDPSYTDPNYSLPPDLANVLATFQQQQQGVNPAVSPNANSTLANVQHILTSFMAGNPGQDGKSDELMEKLRQALEPFKHQLPDFMQGGYHQPDVIHPPLTQPQGPRGPMPSVRPGLLGTAPPGFPPLVGGPGPPPPPPRFPPPGPQGPGLPGEDEWGENMMGGPPPGPMRGGPRFPMRGRGPLHGPPPHMMRGGPGRGRGRGGRGGPARQNRVVCRHFAARGGCMFGDSCAFLHPGINGPPPGP